MRWNRQANSEENEAHVNLTPLIDVSLVLVFTFAGIGILGIFMAGWGSNNKYALVGAMREAAMRGFATATDLADYLVVNVSSPNTVGLRHLQAREALEAVAVEKSAVGRGVGGRGDHPDARGCRPARPGRGSSDDGTGLWRPRVSGPQFLRRRVLSDGRRAGDL